MAATTQNTRRYLMSGALVVAIAAGAYGIGRVYPPLGPSAGTIAPADRYVNAQVGAKDVTLGDTSVAQLMQTDAFEVMSKDKNFRALAADPGFASIAGNARLMQAVAADPRAYAEMAKSPEMFKSALRAASMMSADAASKGPEAIVAQAMAGNQAAFRSFARDPGMLQMMAQHAVAVGALAVDARVLNAVALDAGLLSRMADNPNALVAAMRNPGAYPALAKNAEAYSILARDKGALNALVSDAGLLTAMAQNGPAFRNLAHDASMQPQMLAAMRGMAMKADAFRAASRNAEALTVAARRSDALVAQSMQAQMAAAARGTDAARVAQAYPVAMAAMAANPGMFANLLNNTAAMRVLAKDAQAVAVLAHSADFRTLAANPGLSNAISTGSLAQAMGTGVRSADAAAR